MRFSWKEGKYIDVWAIPHFLSGVTIGLFLFFLHLGFIQSNLIALVVLAGWEIAEIIFKIEEYKDNKYVDIAVGYLGFLLFYILLPLFYRNIFLFSILDIIILLFFSVWGWIRYFKQLEQTNKKF